ncbi:hypothetical protein FB451DRAFT_1399869 [Mycena latifolia]|nr:hypothetical protein FB451DRAFT_1399869 [Mycena latifolia]
MGSLAARPRLPLELERHILELAASLYPRCISALLLVAARVKNWIDPLRYRVLSVQWVPQPNPGSRFSVRALTRLLAAKPPAFFHAHVRHVRFRYHHASADITRTLTICDAIADLGLARIGGGTDLPALLAALPLQRLSLIVDELFPHKTLDDFAHPMFAHVTHLDVLDYCEGGWDTWAGLTRLPALTHLSFHDANVPRGVYEGALAHCAKLQVLVVVCSEEVLLDMHPWASAALEGDMRFVMLYVDDELEDWERGARGGEDYWAVADMMVKARRAKRARAIDWASEPARDTSTHAPRCLVDYSS